MDLIKGICEFILTTVFLLIGIGSIIIHKEERNYRCRDRESVDKTKTKEKA